MATAVVGSLQAHAFSSFSHERITRSAMAFLRAHTGEPDRWLNGPGVDPALVDEALARAVVDTDFRTDIWLDAWFHKPFTAAAHGSQFATLTTLLHYIDVSRPGRYWEYDGYSYAASTHSHEDGYLADISVKLRGDLSAPFGGSYSRDTDPGQPLGPYKLGFDGSDNEWNRVFPHSAPGRKVIFPPANVPAELAVQALLASPRATESRLELWQQVLPAISSIISSTKYVRDYSRSEIPTLPRRFDLLGIAMHMAQDMAIPQHTAGTISLCHADLEDLSDELAAGPVKFDMKLYDQGKIHDDRYPSANGLYDPVYVEELLKTLPFLDGTSPDSIGDRLRAEARYTARWTWEDLDKLGRRTTLPNGVQVRGVNCLSLMKDPFVREQMKVQFNLAVAASVNLFRMVENAYETLHAAEDRDLMNEISRSFE